MKTCKEYRLSAWGSLTGHWTPAVLATLVYIVIAVAFSATGFFPYFFPSIPSEVQYSGNVASILLIMPLSVGIFNAFKTFFRSSNENIISNMFTGAFENYWKNVGAMFLFSLIVCLGTLLLIVPGIILALAYAFVPFILKDSPEIGITYALTESRKMMKGHKWQLFKLYLSFLGWILLGVITAGIALFWVCPYMYTAIAAFYEDVKAEYSPEE